MTLIKTLAALPTHLCLPKAMNRQEKQRGFISYSLKGMDLTYSRTVQKSINFDTVDRALHKVKSLPAQQPFKINALILYCSYTPSYIKCILVEILHTIFTMVELFEDHTHTLSSPLRRIKHLMPFFNCTLALCCLSSVSQKHLTSYSFSQEFFCSHL